MSLNKFGQYHGAYNILDKFGSSQRTAKFLEELTGEDIYDLFGKRLARVGAPQDSLDAVHKLYVDEKINEVLEELKKIVIANENLQKFLLFEKKFNEYIFNVDNLEARISLMEEDMKPQIEKILEENLLQFQKTLNSVIVSAAERQVEKTVDNLRSSLVVEILNQLKKKSKE